MSTIFLNTILELLPAKRVVSDASQIDSLTHTCIPYRQLPAYVIYPTSTEEVQHIVKAAAAAGLPIWTVSTGKNWGYGERTATYAGGILLILEQMNKIIEVNEELAYAVIEPGVTQEQFNTYIRANHPTLWTDSGGTTKSASVLGNALDKGRGLTPHADHFGNLCGLDVVLPSGEVLKTGLGASDNNLTRHLYKWDTGPYLDGLFAQSNLGIVTRAGVWLMRAPERFGYGVFEFKKPAEALAPFVDDLRRLVQSGTLTSFPHVANDYAMLSIVSQYPHHLRKDGETCLSQSALQTWRKEHGVAEWTFGFGLYGSRAVVADQKRAVKRVLARYGRLQFVEGVLDQGFVGACMRYFAPLVNKLLGKSPAFINVLIPSINLFRGIPTDVFVKQVYSYHHPQKPTGPFDVAKDHCGLIWFGPVIPFTGAKVEEALTEAKRVFADHGFDFFVELMVENERSLILLFGIFYIREDEAEQKRATAWHEAINACFAQMGYYPYRATVMSMEHLFSKDPVHKKILHTLKEALDPEVTLAPGKYGIGYRKD